MTRKNFLFTFLTVCSAMFLFSSCGSKKDAAEYNNKIMTIINNSQNDMDAINTAMGSQDYGKVKEAVAKWATAIDKSIKDVEAEGDFNGDATFSKAVVAALSTYKDVATVEYPKLIAAREAAAAGTPPAGGDAMILNSINMKLTNAGNAVNAASNAFERSVSK